MRKITLADLFMRDGIRITSMTRKSLTLEIENDDGSGSTVTVDMGTELPLRGAGLFRQ